MKMTEKVHPDTVSSPSLLLVGQEGKFLVSSRQVEPSSGAEAVQELMHSGAGASLKHQW